MLKTKKLSLTTLLILLTTSFASISYANYEIPISQEIVSTELTIHSETLIPTIEHSIIDVVNVPALPIVQPRSLFLDIVRTNESADYTNSDLFCLAKNIYHEARGEPDLGKYAVAQVTINRVRHNRYPKNICEVVYQPWQFSWANNPSARYYTPSGPAWERSREIAISVLNNGSRINGMTNAIYFHATYVNPRWARAVDRVTQIGNHIFYQ